MKQEITLPKLGESVAEATITAWLKQPGDFIERDETLCEIGTDKVESELPSEFSGVVVELLFSENDVVKVGEVIAIISTDEEETQVNQSTEDAIERSEPINVEPETEGFSQEKTSNNKQSVVGFLTPVVRKMIAVNKIEIDELTKIKPSGENGRITKKDVEAYISRTKATQNLPQSKKLTLKIESEDQVQTLDRTRQLIANHLQRASQLIPHVTTFIEVDVSAMVKKREAEKQTFLANHHSKLTYTHFLQFALIQSLKSFPKLNSWLNEDEWILKNHINLGFAAALPNGNLIVPNVKAIETFEFVDFVKEMNQKAEQAKTGKLKPDDLEQTTFTVSNTGMFGSQMGTPIVSLPQVAVLAFGQILRKPIVQNQFGIESIIAADVMTCSLSYDHRVIDGALASQFLTDFKKRVEAIS